MLMKMYEQLVHLASRRAGSSSGPCLHAGSLCTGSGLGAFAVQAVVEMVCDSVGAAAIKVHHAFACEFDAAKRRWLDQCVEFNATMKIPDITSWGRVDFIRDWISNDWKELITTVDILDAGFSCKDLSSLNTDHVAWTGYIINMLRLVNSEMQLPPGKEDDVEGTTLPTLLGCLRCVFACRPVLVWLENVEGVKQLWDEIHRLMRLMGYCGCMTATEATDYGHVATRLRKQLQFSRSDTMPEMK